MRNRCPAPRHGRKPAHGRPTTRVRVPPAPHGVLGVEQEVLEHLFQLTDVGAHRGQARSDLQSTRRPLFRPPAPGQGLLTTAPGRGRSAGPRPGKSMSCPDPVMPRSAPSSGAGSSAADGSLAQSWPGRRRWPGGFDLWAAPARAGPTAAGARPGAASVHALRLRRAADRALAPLLGRACCSWRPARRGRAGKWESAPDAGRRAGSPGAGPGSRRRTVAGQHCRRPVGPEETGGRRPPPRSSPGTGRGPSRYPASTGRQLRGQGLQVPAGPLVVVQAAAQLLHGRGPSQAVQHGVLASR
jgi:hypothetical protein